MEVWKAIEGFEGLYEVSNLGRVRRTYKTGKEKILKPNKNKKSGYLYICLSRNNKKKTFRVHRLVALHFISNPNNLPEVNHIDEDKSNNVWTNLEWCTSEYNCNYGTRNQRQSEAHKGKEPWNKGKTNVYSEEYKAKIGESHKKKVYCLETDKTYNSIKEASKELNISRSSISNHLHGRSKSCGGYHFIYV